MARVAIVGGGISGLTAAFRLTQLGNHQVTVFECEPETGGMLRSEWVDGCLIERGPDSFLASKLAALELIEELGLAGEVIASSEAPRRTLIARDGALIPLPAGLHLMIPTEWEAIAETPLLSAEAKRSLEERWEMAPPPAPDGEESVASFVRRHYHQELLERIAEPLLSGVYGGDPEQLSVAAVFPALVAAERRAGNLSVAFRKPTGDGSTPGAGIFRALRGGMESLIEALRRRLDGRVGFVHGMVESLRNQGRQIAVGWLDGEYLADQVLLAVPAHVAAGLLGGLVPEAAELLAQIPYSSAATITLFYNRDQVNHPLDAFGFLVPGAEKRDLVACTFVGTKWQDRVPGGRAVLRCFVGGIHKGAIVDLEDDRLVEVAERELSPYLAIDGPPRAFHVQRWPRSMPQYTLGHQERLAQIAQAMEGCPQVTLTGNYFDGVGVPDSIRRATQAACLLESSALSSI